MIRRFTIVNDEKFLRQVSEPVDFLDPQLKSDLKNLKKFCIDNDAFGLAAVQIGIPKRMIYICEDEIYINPKVVEQKGKTEFWELCLSCLTVDGKAYAALVERPYKIRVEYQDVDGKHQNKTIEGFGATVFCHEYDHLNGILHMDRSKKTIVIDFEERVQLREKEPYKVILKD